MVKEGSITFPSALVPGDTIAVVAPSGALRGEEHQRALIGLAWLRQRYKIIANTRIFSADPATGYLAGDDAQRRNEFARAMGNPNVRAIVAIRGGYGVTRIVGELPWAEFARAPKWIVGYSDITGLHMMASAHGVASVHGPNVTGLAKADSSDRASWIASLERPHAMRRWGQLRVVHRGSRIVGQLVGGNLSTIAALAASRELKIPDGAILALEDVGEMPYRVDRLMTSLIRGGYLSKVRAIVFGEFCRCDSISGCASVEDVLIERTAALGIPVLAGAPFGHGARNQAWVSGSTARVDGDALTIEGPPA